MLVKDESTTSTLYIYLQILKTACESFCITIVTKNLI